MLGKPAGTPFAYEEITGGGFFFGDGQVQAWDANSCYSLDNPDENPLGVLYAECLFYHEYATPAVYEAYFLSCCRISRIPDNLQNNDDLQTRISSKVIMSDDVMDSLITGWLPIAAVPIKKGETVATQKFVAFDPNGFAVAFTHADTFTMSGYEKDSIGVPNSVPPTDYWRIAINTGLVTWSNLSGVTHRDFYNAQIYVYDEVTNRTVAVDFLYQIQLLELYCVGPSQGGLSEYHMTSCVEDINCTAANSLAPFGSCDYPSLPEFIDPTPAHGSVTIIYATQPSLFPIVSNRTASHCCEPGEYLYYIEGPMPLGFRDGRVLSGTNPFSTIYKWTPTVDQAGLHQLCWAVCAANDDMPGFVEVCSQPHCIAIFVSLKPNYPPQIKLPEETGTAFGVIAYHEISKELTDLWITDDSGNSDVECHVSVDNGFLTVGSWPEGLVFMNATNGTKTSYMAMYGTLTEINKALYRMEYLGVQGTDTMHIYVYDHGHSGMGQGEPYTGMSSSKDFPITILPACDNACPDDVEIMTGFYHDLGGDGWETKTNWLNGNPCWNYWHGVECTNGKIVSIALTHNKLNGTLPCMLGCVSTLRRLYLMGNSIRGLIPPKYGQLTCLEDLGLSDNQLSWTLPAELSGMGKLRSMQLHNNQLEGSIPAALGSMPNLEQLFLQNNKLSGQIPGSLWDLYKLDYMWIYNNDNLENVPDSWSAERFYTEKELSRTGRENRM